MELIEPDWPAPAWISAFSTTRIGGVSVSPWDSLNLAGHVGDDPHSVARNRDLLQSRFGSAFQPVWLSQVHGSAVADSCQVDEADGRYSEAVDEICAVMTADCLPLLLCNRDGSAVAAVHAGWRGLASGVVENAVALFNCDGADLLAWMGPAIGRNQFEVGAEVKSAFVNRDVEAAVAFRQTDDSHWLADIYYLARLRLRSVGVNSIYGGGYCTVTDQRRFFSFRRDRITGRMASCIWINEDRL